MVEATFEPVLFTPLQKAQKDGYVNITGVVEKRKVLPMPSLTRLSGRVLVMLHG